MTHPTFSSLVERSGLAKTALLLLWALALAPPEALAHTEKKNSLEVVHPWTFATTDNGGATQVFMKIKNLAGLPERLVGASTPAATKAELHEPAGDFASRPVAAVVIGAGKEAELTRKGPYLVLTGVKKRLNAYDSFKLTLVFEKAGRMVVDVTVEEAETESPHKH